jgi:hypothetical protein
VKAQSVLRERLLDEDGDLMEFVLWKVARSRKNPDGIRYRLAFIFVHSLVPEVLYDNHQNRTSFRLSMDCWPIFLLTWHMPRPSGRQHEENHPDQEL